MASRWSVKDCLGTWARLLDSPHVQARDHADRVIRNAGVASVPVLLKLRAGLDARCRARLEQLLEEMSDLSE
jgi:hypothetical protein